MSFAATPSGPPRTFPRCCSPRPSHRTARGSPRRTSLGKAIVWELASGKPVAQVEAPEMYTWDPRERIHSIGGVRALAFSPDSKQLALGGINRIGNIDHLGALARVEVFDWERQERTHEFKGDGSKGIVERLWFGPDGAWLCAVGGDNGGFIQILDMQETSVRKQDKAPMHVHDAVFSDDFAHLHAVGHNKVVTWRMAEEPPLEKLDK